MEIEIRSLAPDDLPAALGLRVQAFSARTQAEFPEEGERYAPIERRLGAFLDGRMVGHAAAWPFGQWVLGRRVPMAGIGAVITTPDARHQRVAPRLLRATIDRAITDGDLVSCLYPSAPGFYRSLGWENAGGRVTRSVRTVALGDLPRPADEVELRPFAWQDDVPAAAAVLDAQARTGHGCLDRGEAFHLRMLEPDDGLSTWVARRDGRVTGLLSVHKSAAQPDDGHVAFRQKVLDLAATDHDSWLALWHLVASNAPVCTVTSWLSSPADPVLDQLALAAVDTRPEYLTWMARVLDAAGAVAARGWPAGAQAEVHLHLDDPWLEDNDGDWVLTVADGQGRLEPGGAGTVRLAAGPFAQLWTGYTSASDLRRVGRLDGPDEAVAELDEAFRSPPPFMRVYF